MPSYLPKHVDYCHGMDKLMLLHLSLLIALVSGCNADSDFGRSVTDVTDITGSVCTAFDAEEDGFWEAVAARKAAIRFWTDGEGKNYSAEYWNRGELHLSTSEGEIAEASWSPWASSESPKLLEFDRETSTVISFNRYVTTNDWECWSELQLEHYGFIKSEGRYCERGGEIKGGSSGTYALHHEQGLPVSATSEKSYPREYKISRECPKECGTVAQSVASTIGVMSLIDDSLTLTRLPHSTTPLWLLESIFLFKQGLSVALETSATDFKNDSISDSDRLIVSDGMGCEDVEIQLHRNLPIAIEVTGVTIQGEDCLRRGPSAGYPANMDTLHNIGTTEVAAYSVEVLPNQMYSIYSFETKLTISKLTARGLDSGISYVENGLTHHDVGSTALCSPSFRNSFTAVSNETVIIEQIFPYDVHSQDPPGEVNIVILSP